MLEKAQQQIKQSISFCYESLAAWSKPAAAILFDLFLDVYILEAEKENSKNLKIITLGKSSAIEYISGRLFKSISSKKYLGKICILKILFNGLKNFSADIAVLRISSIAAAFIKKENLILIPEWIGFEDSLSKAISPESYFGQKERKNFFENKNFTYAIKTDILDFEYFYNNMYQPYLKARFKNAAYLVSKKKLKNIFKSGVLMYVLKDNIPSAGLLYFKKKGKVYFSKIGVRDGDYNLLKEGAVEALYYYFLKILKSESVQKEGSLVNFGGARPFFNDGGFKFKEKWLSGKIAYKESPYNFYIEFRDNSKEEFLNKNQFFDPYKKI